MSQALVSESSDLYRVVNERILHDRYVLVRTLAGDDAEDGGMATTRLQAVGPLPAVVVVVADTPARQPLRRGSSPDTGGRGS